MEKKRGKEGCTCVCVCVCVCVSQGLIVSTSQASPAFVEQAGHCGRCRADLQRRGRTCDHCLQEELMVTDTRTHTYTHTHTHTINSFPFACTCPCSPVRTRVFVLTMSHACGCPLSCLSQVKWEVNLFSIYTRALEAGKQVGPHTCEIVDGLRVCRAPLIYACVHLCMYV